MLNRLVFAWKYFRGNTDSDPRWCNNISNSRVESGRYMEQKFANWRNYFLIMPFNPPWAKKIIRKTSTKPSNRFRFLTRFTFDRQLDRGERVSQIFANAPKKVSGKQRDLYSTLMFPANLLNLILNLVYGDTFTCTWSGVLERSRIIPATSAEQ